MSIGTAVLAVGKFLSGPIVTGAANVATFANLGLGIATKVDTSQIKSTVGGIRSDLNAVDNNILALTENIDDFRQENRWNVALAGGRPVVITGGSQPQYAQLQVQQPQQVQQQVVESSAPVQYIPAQQFQPQAQAPVQTVTVNSAPQTPPASDVVTESAPSITKDEFNTGLTNLMNGLGNMMSGFVQELKAMTDKNGSEAAPASTEKKDG